MIWEAFYFETTPTQLIARNYLLPFIYFRYNLNEITQIELCDSSWNSTALGGLKIYRTNGRQSSAYISSSLMRKDWLALVADLKARRIHIVNSSIKLDKIELTDN